QRFATSFELGGAAYGLLVTSYDGRPVKVEGNPLHPQNRGTADRLAQASVLEIYDPDRSKRLVRRGGGTQVVPTWEDFAGFAKTHFASLKEKGGEGLAVLCENTSSPSFLHYRERFLSEFPKARWHEYEAISRDNEREGARFAFGTPLRAQLSLEKAKVIVSFDSDFLMDHPSALKLAREYADGRTPDHGEINRLYVLESAFSVTGANADHRFALPPSLVTTAALYLLCELAARHSLVPSDLDKDTRDLLGPTKYPDELHFIPALANDLARAKGESVVIAGPRQPAAVHALVHAINLALGNVGETVNYTQDLLPERPSHTEAIRSLCEEMRNGGVETLLIVGGNPVFDAPADLGFESALAKVATSIHLSLYDNETSQKCTWHLPRAHYLEAWGDARAWDGTISLIQPLIAPLYDGKTPTELLSLLLGDSETNGPDIVRSTIQSLRGKAFDENDWRKAVHDGFVADSAFKSENAKLNPSGLADAFAEAAHVSEKFGREQGLELVFAAHSSVHDGRFANNGWLQELPDPLTKLTWDSAVLVPVSNARELGLSNGDMVRLDLGKQSVDMPVYLMPGQARGSVTVILGQGRRAAGHVGNGVGFNAYPLRATDSMYLGAGLLLRKRGTKYKFAATQDHHLIDPLGAHERERRLHSLAREGTIEEYAKNPAFAQELDAHERKAPLWTAPEGEGPQWGMTIDLNTCIGCNACVVACQSENNIPVVGKERVADGREMQWIRIDRYFKGAVDEPEVVNQPVACVHCETAPCESVCPVAATNHSKEGLNVMVYNRCVGTRYCSNNCPYKVRRFNFFNYTKHYSETEKMQHNPEVTVRSRGVMEKCTYCVQRIEHAKIEAKNERRPVKDGEIVPACQQTCPTQAIVFGNLADSESRVSKLHQSPRSYELLGEMNTRPRTKYLANLRNPNPEIREG
ncbi:MAG: 4Fe-4S dicluster domain-containing protein, partial [bacterium]